MEDSKDSPDWLGYQYSTFSIMACMHRITLMSQAEHLQTEQGKALASSIQAPSGGEGPLQAILRKCTTTAKDVDVNIAKYATPDGRSALDLENELKALVGQQTQAAEVKEAAGRPWGDESRR